MLMLREWGVSLLQETNIPVADAYTCNEHPNWFAWSKITSISARVAHSNTEIVCSNPTRGMDVCVCFFSVCVVLCVGSDLG
jgi:hypothetical protein